MNSSKSVIIFGQEHRSLKGKGKPMSTGFTGIEREERLRYWLGGTEVGKRLFLGLLFFVSLSFFLHFREVGMEVLEVGTLAPRYVIAQVDFTFPDDEATQTLMQEAARDIGMISRIEDREIHQKRIEIENELIQSQRWRQALPEATFEEIYKGLDQIEEFLSKARFTDQRTLQRIKNLQKEGTQYYAASLLGEIPENLWDETFAIERVSKECAHFLAQAFQEKRWILTEDLSAERGFRSQVQDGVAQKYTHVDAGSQIVEIGERVSHRHIAMIQAMQNAMGAARNLWMPMTLLGSAILGFCLTVISVAYLRLFHKELLESIQKVSLLVAIIIITLIFSKIIEYLLLYFGTNLVEVARFPLIVPLSTILVSILVGSTVAMGVTAFLVVILGVTLAFDHDLFFLMNFFAALVSLFWTRTLTKRKEVFSICGKTWLCCVPILIAYNLGDNVFWNHNLLTDLLWTGLFMATNAVLLVGLLPLLESFFHVMTNMTLMEYMDPNHQLLRRLSIEAPGTYQHCLVVGNLAEAAARAIGANSLLCRVSTLYHDVGKLFNPHYFTENQLGGFNIHQLLTPVESTQVIIAHVAEGEALAKKYRLPQSFIDVISEHHGSSMVYYFYCKQVEQMKGDTSKVNEEMFRYPGPKPRSKESAIIMLADTLEAASRSMDDITEESLSNMVDKLVAEKLEDGQFDRCQLTFEELGEVKKAMVRALMITRHMRVKYPEK